MAAFPKRVLGFTLIELMVTVAVIITLLVLALPSFFSMRQRAALRGAAEETASLWSQARFEAAKRNEMVKFGVFTSGTDYCIGAAITDDADDEDPCDCFDATACDVAKFPSDQGEWRSVTLSGTPTLGNGVGANKAVVVLDPKRSALTESADAGGITFNGPPGGSSYSLSLLIDQFGRGVLCEPSATSDKLSDFSTRQCNP